jgi:hypothetical protein
MLPHKSKVPRVINGAAHIKDAAQINRAARDQRCRTNKVPCVIKGAAQINGAARDQGCRA